jgi:hypothetical protein
MLRAQIEVTYGDGRVVEFDGKGRLWIDFESKVRLTHFWWMGYMAAKMENKHGGVEFSAWADGVDNVNVEWITDPLEKRATPISSES